MGTNVRTKLSKSNKYYIPQHRRLELVHYCLQYPMWKDEYIRIENRISNGLYLGEKIDTSNVSDSTADIAMRLEQLSRNIDLIDRTLNETDTEIQYYLKKGVTEGIPFQTLLMVYGAPCGKDLYYDRYRKFFWILDKYRC